MKERKKEKFDGNFIHYKKINIFGAKDVGKTSFINYLSNIDEFDLNFDSDNDEGELVQQIKKAYLNYKETSDLYLYLYETNIDNMENITTNLNTLISYSEFLIFIIDITSKNSFEKAKELIDEISKIKNVRIPPIFFLSNKIDLEKERKVTKESLNELFDRYKIMNHFSISLAEKTNLDEFLDKFFKCLNNEEENNSNEFPYKCNLIDPPKCFPKTLTNKNYKTINLYFFGSTRVGKSSLILKFTDNQFSDDTLSTIGYENICSMAKIKEEYVKVIIWDTAGQERLRSIPKSHYSKADGILLLFDVTNRESFKGIKSWIKDIRENRNENQDYKQKSKDEVLFLIGNKIDKLEERNVKREEAEILAKEYNVSYFETSCKDGINIYEIMCHLIYDTYQKISNDNDNIKHIQAVKLNAKMHKDNSNNDDKKKKCCLSKS